MGEVTLKDTLEKMSSTLDELVEKKQIKKWNVPWWKRLSRGKARKNWALICHVSENKGVSFVKAQIDEGVIMINGIPHTVSPDEIMFYKKMPFLIVPSWSTKPFSAKDHIQNTIKDGNSSMGWEFIYNHMKKTTIKSVKNVGIMMWIIVGAVILGGAYYLLSNGGLV